MKGNPRFFITMGDPLGIGPEIVAKALSSGKLPKTARWTVIGCKRTLFETADSCGLKVSCDIVDVPFKGAAPSGLNGSGVQNVVIGPERAAGAASLDWVRIAAEGCLAKETAGMVTAPICKESWKMAGCGEMGHTDYLASLCGCLGQERLMLIHAKMLVVHVTCHQSLRDAIESIDKDRILQTVMLADRAVSSYLNRRPRIVVSGLNPHAGEAGIMGDEEIRHIIPAVKKARSLGVDIAGPLPPDTVFAAARSGKFDLVVSMIHDHGHVAVKTMAMNLGSRRKTAGVNATLGLPFIRTSVDHGVAFDIAGKNMASEGSLLDAARAAVRLGRMQRNTHGDAWAGDAKCNCGQA